MVGPLYIVGPGKFPHPPLVGHAYVNQRFRHSEPCAICAT